MAKKTATPNTTDWSVKINVTLFDSPTTISLSKANPASFTLEEPLKLTATKIAKGFNLTLPASLTNNLPEIEITKLDASVSGGQKSFVINEKTTFEPGFILNSFPDIIKITEVDINFSSTTPKAAPAKSIKKTKRKK